MKEIRQLIKSYNWQGILNWANSLNAEERLLAIDELNTIDIDKELMIEEGHLFTGKKRNDFYDTRQKIRTLLQYAKIVCTRTYEDVERTAKENGQPNRDALYLYIFQPSIGFAPLVEFFKIQPPTYLDLHFKKLLKDRFFNADFKVLWKLYEHGWMSFDEEFFVRRLFIIYGFDNNHIDDADFLLENPDLINKVFLQFYKYEIPVLDRIKCDSLDYPNGMSLKADAYWTEVFKILIEKKAITDRVIIKHLLESLLNNWKKPHLDWHIRLIELFKPTKQEYLEYQNLLFSVLNSDNYSIINFSVKTINTICSDKQFNFEAFISNSQAVFTKEKCEKAIITILEIIEKETKNKPAVQKEIPNLICLALIQTDLKVQTKTAELILKYAKHELLEEIITPYVSSLKQKTKDILGIKDLDVVEELPVPVYEEFQPVSMPSGWNDLLFHIGTCINTKSATDIDLFLEGLNQLQDQIPVDFVKQLKPYTKQLFGRFWEIETMIFFTEFFENWINNQESNYKKTVKEREGYAIPFLRKKCVLLFDKLKKHNNLPFLSTPTHLPFYIHPEVLVDRILLYEQNRENIDIEDLIVATNRTSLTFVNDNIKEKTKKLKGNYAKAIQYFFGITETMEIEETLLPLWTQVARTRNPNAVYKEFENYPTRKYPSVVEPFLVGFKINVDKDEQWTWYRLKIDKRWNETRWYSKEKMETYPPLFYYPSSYIMASRTDIYYQISLVPQYVDPIITRYIPDTASGNEVTEQEYCLYPIQYILGNRLIVRHSGWLYVAVCLLFEKKISRDLASEYILFSMANNTFNQEYMVNVLARLLVQKYAPVNRLVEYLDKTGLPKEVKLFQFKVLKECILLVKEDDIPVNFKKIVAGYLELLAALKQDMVEEIEIKMKKLKK